MITGNYLFMAAFLCFIYQVIDRSDSVLAGMRKPIVNVIYTFIRLVMLPPFVIYLFSENLKYGLNGIWWAIFATNAFGALLIYINMKYLYNKEYKKSLIKIT
jgi:Na+-driven multidrug efflux pump